MAILIKHRLAATHTSAYSKVIPYCCTFESFHFQDKNMLSIELIKSFARGSSEVAMNLEGKQWPVFWANQTPDVKQSGNLDLVQAYTAGTLG